MKTKCTLILMTLCLAAIVSRAQVPLKVTGGIELTKGNIQPDVLMEVIQQKQEEVFNRLFANLVIEHFERADRSDGVYNVPTYFALYNIMTDMTIGKSKTTVSKSIITNASELAYVYAFSKYYQKTQLNNGGENGIDKSNLLKEVTKSGKVEPNKDSLLTLNYYLDAAFEVLAKHPGVQSTFTFKRSIEEEEIKEWYKAISVEGDPQFTDVTGTTIRFSQLVNSMRNKVDDFLSNRDTTTAIGRVLSLQKNVLGFTGSFTDKDVEALKLTLLEFGSRSDYLFSQNVAKTLLRLIVENMHVELNTGGTAPKQVYIDVEALILSLDKEFVTKNKKSPTSSPLFFLNFRPFLTIGTSSAFFLNANTLGAPDDSGNTTSMHNITLASEKIGFRAKIWDGGYTRSFGPGEAYKYHGVMTVNTEPRKKPMISSVYYNIYASGLLYNILDLKTNKNFDYGLFGTNVGMIFFNGLELSVGYGLVYDKGFSSDNGLIKIDFDIPIVDYLAALKRKQK